MDAKARLPVAAKKIIYLTLYDQGNAVLKRYNPCKIENGRCAGGYADTKGLCCDTCKHLGPEGCTVKSLECKMWLCEKIKYTEDGAKAAVALHVLHMTAHDLRIPHDMRKSFEETFGG